MSLTNVFHPNPDFTGTVVPGGRFVNGRATVEGSALAYFRRQRSQGYLIGDDADEVVLVEEQEEVEDSIDEEAADPVVDEVEIPGMPKSNASRGEFAEFAEGMGLETEGLTKAQIIAAIKKESTK